MGAARLEMSRPTYHELIEALWRTPPVSLLRTALVACWALLLAPAPLAAGDIEERGAPPFGDTEHLGAPPLRGIVPEQRIIEHQLDTSQSRVLRHSQRRLEKEQLQRDLGAAGQNLSTFKTQHPNAAATPLLEGQLDRSNRPARIREPGPPTLLDQSPTLLERR